MGLPHFVFYRLDVTKTRATFCGWVQAKAGEQVVMPPDLYHLTINAGTVPLLFADVISKHARGLYDDVRCDPRRALLVHDHGHMGSQSYLYRPYPPNRMSSIAPR